MYDEHDDAEFRFFMRKVDALITRLTGMSVYDFADAMWYDLFEEMEGETITREDIIETLADADDIFRMMMEQRAA
jgi:hypothetical protein